LNNPLMYTDPSGHFVVTFAMIFQAVHAAFIAYALSKGDVRMTVAAFFTAGMSAYIGSLYNVATMTIAQAIERAAFHALSGGISSVISGGDFISGAVGAGLTAGLSPAIGGIGNDGLEIIAAGVISGVAATVAGAKFMAGFMRGSLQYLFNDLGDHEVDSHGRGRPTNDHLLVEMPNGSKEWFPSKVALEMKLSGTTDISYEQLPVAGASGVCNELCVSVEFSRRVITGEPVAEAAGKVGDLMQAGGDQMAMDVGKIISRTVLPVNAIGAAMSYDKIQKTCTTACSRSFE